MISNALRFARTEIANGTTPFLALYSACDGPEFNEACQLLQSVFLPTANQLEEMVARYAAKPSDVAGRAAIAAAKLPGADQQLWDWIESPQRTRLEILQGFDRAILRSKSER